jgi:hypothetical protein
MAFAGRVGVALNVDMLVTEGDGIRQPHGHGRQQELGGQVSAAAKSSRSRPVQRRAGRGAAGAHRERSEVMQVLREHGLSKHSHFIGKTRPASTIDAGKGELQVWRDAKAVFSAPCRPAPGVGQRELEDLPAARQPRLRRCRARRRWCARPTPACMFICQIRPAALVGCASSYQNQ